MDLQPSLSQLAQQVLALQNTPPDQQVPFLLSLLDLAGQHPMARVSVLHQLQAVWPQQVQPPPIPLTGYVANQVTRWLVESSQWLPVP